MEDLWINVKDRMPEINGDFNESAYCQVFNANTICYAVAWYDGNKKEWIASYYSLPNTPIEVTHWKPLKEFDFINGN